MLTSLSAVGRLLERLEVHYLANPEPGLSFALVTDFADGPAEETPDDKELLTAATAGVAASTRDTPAKASRSFILLHRRPDLEPGRKDFGWVGNANAASCWS